MDEKISRKDDEDKMNKVINLKMTEEFKAQLEDAAKKEKTTVSRIIREGAEARIKFGRIKVAEPKFVKVVPLAMSIPCGDPDDLDDLINSVGDGESIDVTGELAGSVTPHAFVMRAEGWSMMDDERIDGIYPGDWLLMIPLNEYRQNVINGTIVFVKIKYKNGDTKATLKSYQGKVLKPNNPKFENIEFGDDVLWAQVMAIAIGRVRNEEIFSK